MERSSVLTGEVELNMSRHRAYRPFRRWSPHRQRPILGHVLLVVVFLELICGKGLAQETGVQSPSPPNFHQLHTSRMRETFVAIRDAVQKNPDATDTVAARSWILTTAREFGWEADAVSIAELPYTEGVTVSADMAQLALAVRAIGWAQRGDVESASMVWSQFLRALRLRQPNEAGAVAQSVALAWQLRQQVDQADAVYQQLSEAYFLNAELKEFAERRRARLKLVGQAAPELSQPDLAGHPLRWSDRRGQVVLLDFWATNCRPCIEELPRLRRRYAEFQPLGVQFMGVSFDESSADIEAFTQTQPIPWPVVLDRATAEEAFGVTLIPCLMIIDQTGQIAATDIRPEDLSGALDRVLQRRTKE